MLFAFLDEHLSKSSSREGARLDQLLYDKLSDYATNHEMLVAVRLHRPQNTSRHIKEVLECENRKPWRYIDATMEIPWADMVKLAKCLKSFHQIPTPSRRKDQAWLERTEMARNALEHFWTTMRDCWRNTLMGKKFSSDDIQSDLEVLSANINPEYVAAVQAERQGVLESIAIAAVPTIVPLQTQWGRTEIVESLNTKTKSKAKTRAEQLDSLPEAESTPVAKPEKIQSKMRVKKRTFDIFAMMFPASNEEAAKSLNWDVFVHAMADVGFSARHGGGSAVVFEKEDDIGEGKNRKIVFHKPHPIAKIDPVMFRSMGRRMRKWFGWHRDLFLYECEED
jgi:hypothetical protein